MRHNAVFTKPSKGTIAEGINLLEQEPEWISGARSPVTIARELK
jgi:hypothetical protein